MVELSPRTKELLIYAAVGLILLSIIAFNWFVFWELSYLVTGYGAVVLFMLYVYYFTHKICEVLVFPGSFTYFRRSTESNFCQELTKRLARDVQLLRFAVEVVLKSVGKSDRKDFFRSPHTALKAKRRVLSVVRSLEKV
jgi:hypothetical protein